MNWLCGHGWCMTCTNRCEGFFKQFQSDWDEINEFSPKFILNKPLLDSGLSKQDVLDILSDYLTLQDFNNFLTLIHNTVGDIENNQSLVITLIDDLKFRYGVNTVTTLVDLPVSKQSVVAILSGANTLSIASDMKPGQVINVKVNVTAYSVIDLPISAGWTLMNDNPLEVNTNETVEINIWCTGTGLYSVKTIISM